MSENAKQDVIFDECAYYGAAGEELAVTELSERDETSAEEVRQTYSKREIFEEAIRMCDFDLEEELDALEKFFSGDRSLRFGFNNPYGGNMLLVRGSAQTYFGTRRGLTAYPDFRSAVDTSPSHFDLGNIFSDCELDKIWQEDGSLFVTGCHHDGRVTVEVRQLTDAGQALVDSLLIDETGFGHGSCKSLYLPEEEVEAFGGRFSEGQEDEFMRALWEAPGMCPPACYLEKCYGFNGNDTEVEAMPETPVPTHAADKAK